MAKKDKQPAQDEAAEEEVVDLELERNLKVTAMMEDGHYDRVAAAASYGTTQDGLEDAPSHREGEVWESMAPEDDEAGGGRRRVRVQVVEGGEVTAVNLVTNVVSHFQAENLSAPRWRRTHS